MIGSPPVADTDPARHSAGMNPLLPRAAAIAALLLACSPGAAALKKGEERWVASSRTAMGITGDLLLSQPRLVAAGRAYPLRVATDLAGYGSELGRVAAPVLEVTRPLDPPLQRGNHHGCGKPIRWIVVWRQDGGKGLGMETFSSAAMPRSAKSPGFCASYFYMRP